MALPTNWNRHAILLAAGGGRRFGGRKMLADWSGEALVVAAARIALAAPVARVTVVTGADGAEVERTLQPLAGPRLRTVRNAEWRSGIASSLRVGLDALPEDAACAIVFLGDMPEVPVDGAAWLLEALAAGAPAALTEYQGKPAHPVAFARSVFAQLRDLQGDLGARHILSSLPGVARVASQDSGSLFDMDAPRDRESAPSRPS